ncbi:MAG TPA: class I SAM-dependent methyltransferase [Byssovorax sp.]|jgi:SAM-dependent methyltransferase
MDFAPFDKRNYPMLGVREGYGEWVTTYEATVSDVMDIRLLTRADVAWSGAEILDLACGTGRIGRWTKAQGARAVDGVDMTPEMLERARASGVYRELVLGDIRSTAQPDAAYDVCTQSLACEHLPDVAPLYAEAARVTRPGGRFVLVGYHPHFMMMGIPTHFDRAAGVSVAIDTHLHHLSEHAKAARAAGFSIESLDESVVDEALLAIKPKWAKFAGQPMTFCFVFAR